MDFVSSVNWISIIVFCLFVIPVITGMVRPFSSENVQNSIISLVDVLELLLSVILSLYITRTILTDANNGILTTLYKIIPPLKAAVEAHNIWVYLIFIVVILFIVDGILHLLVTPFYKYGVVPMSEAIATRVNTMKSVPRRIIGGLWRLPVSVLAVLVFCLGLSLLTGFFSNSPLADYANESGPYQFVNQNAVGPLLQSGVIKNIQVLLSDTFKSTGTGISGQSGKLQLIRYFNGVTLDQAVKSDAEIDAMAKKAVGVETDEKQKAYLVYKWVCKNIVYDNAKAEEIAKNPSGVSSGAIVCFNTKEGVCFDYATLYVAMCRAVGVKVRFLTGLGFSGTSWGDHAWNQVYDSETQTWLNVDTTFGSSGMDYFNRPDFDLDHQDGQVQEEWQSK